jgi:uncharacterized protein
MSLISQIIATELNVGTHQVDAAIQLLDNGDTVPFIARYRKEVTQGLDDTQLRTLEERMHYLRELAERRAAILKEIETQGKLTPELTTQINEADNKARLEDLYKPYKPKRRTRGQIAIEAGLQPLADQLYADPTLVPEAEALKYIDAEKGIADTKAALEGARYILMERFADEANLVGDLREKYWQHGVLTSQVKAGKEQEGQKFSDYFAFAEKINIIPSHRALAVLRGRNTGMLQINLEAEYPFEADIAAYFNISQQSRAADTWLLEVVKWTWQVKLKVQLEVELITRMRENSDQQAIAVFAANLRDLLMAAPAGMKTTIGLDPGFRTGVKATVVDQTGQFLHHATIFPHQPQKQWDASLQTLAEICQKYNVELISIGNGTASRETDQLAAELMQKHPELKLTKIVVSEAGASVYSASALAAEEFPNLDVTLRGAVSIARRLQDPLAELVKIEPKSIGVGQYQHDVNQVQLGRSLEAVVEDCVNNVGVDVNTASSALLARVAGLNQQLAENIVSYRNQHGTFVERGTLKQVTRLGPKAFEQAAGFLRIMNGSNPLDGSAVHPESYPVVTKILEVTHTDVRDLIGNKEVLSKLDPKAFIDDRFGLPTVVDIIKELEKPGRDPRPEFKTAQFQADVNTLKDLKVGMILEGAVTNVANFGAFVDIGVHQDGLVHISALANRFVKDPREIVKAGDIVKVKVLEVDVERKRISLTMRLEEVAPPVAREQNANSSSERPRSNYQAKPAAGGSGARTDKPAREKRQSAGPSTFGSALMDALKGKSTDKEIA